MAAAVMLTAAAALQAHTRLALLPLLLLLQSRHGSLPGAHLLPAVQRRSQLAAAVPLKLTRPPAASASIAAQQQLLPITSSTATSGSSSAAAGVSRRLLMLMRMLTM
jgi:hypothetical protein